MPGRAQYVLLQYRVLSLLLWKGKKIGGEGGKRRAKNNFLPSYY